MSEQLRLLRRMNERARGQTATTTNTSEPAVVGDTEDQYAGCTTIVTVTATAGGACSVTFSEGTTQADATERTDVTIEAPAGETVTEVVDTAGDVVVAEAGANLSELSLLSGGL